MYRLSVYSPCLDTYIHKMREATLLMWAVLWGATTGNGAWARLSLGAYFNQTYAGSAPGRKPGLHVMLLSRWLLSQLDALSLPLGLLPPHFDLIKI